MNISRVVFPRMTHAGDPNVNTKKVYPNLEEEIQSMMRTYDNKVPIAMGNSEERSFERSISTDHSEAVGFVTRVDDVSAVVELNEKGQDLYDKGELNHCAVQFFYIINTRTECVISVIKPILSTCTSS